MTEVFSGHGRPGAGKGTAFTALTNMFYEGFVRTISPGELGRQARVEKSGPIYELFEPHYPAMDRGELIDPNIIRAAIGLKLDQMVTDPSTGIVILDGYPRSLAQRGDAAEMIDGLRERGLVGGYHHIDLRVTEETALARLTGRANESVEKRADDKIEVQRRRLEVFKSQTQPLIDHLEEAGQLIVIDAERPAREVLKSTIGAVIMRRLSGNTVEQPYQAPSKAVRLLEAVKTVEGLQAVRRVGTLLTSFSLR